MIIITVKLLTHCIKVCSVVFKSYFLKKLLTSVTLTLTLLLSILTLSLNMKIMSCINVIMTVMRFKAITYQL